MGQRLLPKGNLATAVPVRQVIQQLGHEQPHVREFQRKAQEHLMYWSKSHFTSSAAPWLSFGRIQQPGNLDSVLGRRRCGFELCRVHMNLTNVVPHWTVYSKTATDSTKIYIYLYSKRSSHYISYLLLFFFPQMFSSLQSSEANLYIHFKK